MTTPHAGGGSGDELRRFRRLVDLTVIATLLLIVVGGIVRVTDSGLGCGPGGSGTEGWPLCNGEAVPFFHDTEVIIEFSHRVLAAIVTGLIALMAWIAYRQLREYRWPLRLSLAAGALVLVQAALGGLTVEKGLAEELVAAHLGLAMVLIGLLLWIAVRVRTQQGELRPPEPRAATGDGPRTTGAGRGLRPVAAVAAVLLLGTIVAGGYVAGTEKEGVHGSHVNVNGAHMACGNTFPRCLDDRILPFGESRLTDIHLTHRSFVYLATAAILLLLGLAWARGVRSRLIGLALLLLLSQIALGVLNVTEGEHAGLIVAHLVVATLLWSTLLLFAYRFAFAPAPVGATARPAGPRTAAVEAG